MIHAVYMYILKATVHNYTTGDIKKTKELFHHKRTQPLLLLTRSFKQLKLN